jgi:hypothetical protein
VSNVLSSKSTHLGVDENCIGRQVEMNALGLLMKERETFGDLQGSLLDFDLVEINLGAACP